MRELEHVVLCDLRSRGDLVCVLGTAASSKSNTIPPIPVLLELRISGMKMAAKQAYFLFSSVLSTPMREEGCVGDGVT